MDVGTGRHRIDSHTGQIPMTFAHPHLLWLLLLLPLLWFVRRRWQRPPAAWPFSDLSLLGDAGAADSCKPLRWLSAIKWGVLVLALIALAQPRWLEQRAPKQTESRAIQLVLDVSGSMGEADFLGPKGVVTRLQAAKDWLEALFKVKDGTNQRADDFIGLITFATFVEDVSPPTLSHATVWQMLQQAEPIGQIPDNTTNIGDALLLAIERCRQATPQEKVILLLSDGEHNVPTDRVSGAWTPLQAAHLARSLGIRIHTIFISGTRSTESPDWQERQSAAQASFREVARLTHGSAFAAKDQESLQQIAASLDALPGSPITSEVLGIYFELYPWLLGLATCCLLGVIVYEEMCLRVLT